MMKHYHSGMDGRDETHAKHETAEAVAVRLALLEAADPSQRRPVPKHNPNNNVDWIEV